MALTNHLGDANRFDTRLYLIPYHFLWCQFQITIKSSKNAREVLKVESSWPRLMVCVRLFRHHSTMSRNSNDHRSQALLCDGYEDDMEMHISHIYVQENAFSFRNIMLQLP